MVELNNDVLRTLPQFAILKETLPFQSESAILDMLRAHVQNEEKEKERQQKEKERQRKEKISQLGKNFVADLKNLNLESENGWHVSLEGVINISRNPRPPRSDFPRENQIQIRRAVRNNVKSKPQELPLQPACISDDDVGCSYTSKKWNAPCKDCGRLRRCNSRGRGQTCSPFKDSICTSCKRECLHKTRNANGRCNQCRKSFKGTKKAVKTSKTVVAPKDAPRKTISKAKIIKTSRILQKHCAIGQQRAEYQAKVLPQEEPDVFGLLKDFSKISKEIAKPPPAKKLWFEEVKKTKRPPEERLSVKQGEEVLLALVEMFDDTESVSIAEAQDYLEKVLGFKLRPIQVRRQLKKLKDEDQITTIGKTSKTRYVRVEKKPEIVSSEATEVQTLPLLEPEPIDLPEAKPEAKPALPARPTFFSEPVEISKVIRSSDSKAGTFVIILYEDTHELVVSKHFRQKLPLAGNFCYWNSMASMLKDATIRGPLEDKIRGLLPEQGKRNVVVETSYPVGWATSIEKHFVSDEQIKDNCLTDLSIPAPFTKHITFELFVKKGKTHDHAVIIDAVYPGKPQESDVRFQKEASGLDFNSSYWDDRKDKKLQQLVKYLSYHWPRRNGTTKEDFVAELGIPAKLMNQLLGRPEVLASIRAAKKQKSKKSKSEDDPSPRRRVVCIGNKIKNTLRNSWLKKTFDLQTIDTEKSKQFSINKKPDLIICFTNNFWHKNPSAKKEAIRWGVPNISGKSLLKIVEKAKINPQLNWFVDACQQEHSR